MAKKIHDDIYPGLRKRLKMIRKERGLSQEKLGEILHHSQQTIYKLEKGDIAISAQDVYNLHVLSERSLDWIMTGSEEDTGNDNILSYVPLSVFKMMLFGAKNEETMKDIELLFNTIVKIIEESKMSE